VLRAYCTCAVLAGTLSAADRDGKASLNVCKLLQMAPNSAVGGFSVLLNRAIGNSETVNTGGLKCMQSHRIQEGTFGTTGEEQKYIRSFGITT